MINESPKLISRICTHTKMHTRYDISQTQLPDWKHNVRHGNLSAASEILSLFSLRVKGNVIFYFHCIKYSTASAFIKVVAEINTTWFPQNRKKDRTQKRTS